MVINEEAIDEAVGGLGDVRETKPKGVSWRQ